MDERTYWLKADTWQLHEAVLILNGYLPSNQFQDEIDSLFSSGLMDHDHYHNGHFWDFYPDATPLKMMFMLALRSLSQKTLEGTEHAITPRNFIFWAKEKGFDIPPQFSKLLDIENNGLTPIMKQVTKKKKHSREKEEICALAQKLKKDNPDLSAPQFADDKRALKIISGLGFADPERTIIFWVKDIPRKAKPFGR